MSQEDKKKYVRHYDCVEIVIPRDNDAFGGCPLGRENCYDCEHLIRGGLLDGKVWIDCGIVEEEDDLENFIKNEL